MYGGAQPFAALEDVDLVDGVELEDPLDAPESLLVPDLELSALSPARFFLSPVLKSVSYQPPPFRRKAAALTFLRNRGSPHSGQSTNGASLIF